MTRRKSASDLLRDDPRDVEDAIMAERKERDERWNGPVDCCCKHPDARACFLIRHPECHRNSDDIGGHYDATVDEVCECYCHKESDECDDFYSSQPAAITSAPPAGTGHTTANSAGTADMAVDPVAAANERIMADLGRALDMALPAERPYCAKCLSLFAMPGSRLCEGCAKDNAIPGYPDREGDFDDDWVGDAR